MTDQTPPQGPNPKRPPIDPKGRLRAVVPGRPVRSREFSQAEAQQVAERLYRDSRSNLRTYVVKLLQNFLALTEERIFKLCLACYAISENADSFAATLNRYQRDGVIMRLPYPVMQIAHGAGLQPPAGRRLVAYALGPVGEELASVLVGDDIPPLRQARGDIRWAHDLLCAEAMWRLTDAWRAAGWQAEPVGPQGAAIWYVNERDPNAKGRFVLKPDGLIRFQDAGKTPGGMLVEFQHNSFGKDAKPKLRGYRQFFGSADYAEHWRAQWRLTDIARFFDGEPGHGARPGTASVPAVAALKQKRPSNCWASSVALAPARKGRLPPRALNANRPGCAGRGGWGTARRRE